MLTFESPFYEIGGVVVFRDHADPRTFHYLAGPPHLTRDEHAPPSLLLLKYRKALDAMGADAKTRADLGGGFLMLGVDCGLPQAKKDDISRELQNQVEVDGEISLVPVLFTRGRVSIVALDAQQAAAGAPTGDGTSDDRMVRGVQGTTTPSLLQDERAIFSLSLTPDAVTLIEDAYDSELSPIGVMYELEFAGLRPAIAVKAHVDKSRVYEQFKLAFHAGFRSGGSGGTTPAATTTPVATTPATATAAGTTPATTTPATTTPATTTPATTAPARTNPTTTTAGGTGAGTPQGAAPVTTPGATTPAAGTAGTPGTPPATTPAAPAAGTPAAGTAGTSPTGGTTTPAAGQGANGTGSSGTAARPASTEVAISADITYQVEHLVETGAIKLEIVREQEGASVDEMQRNALDLLKETLLNEFFRPAMSDASSTLPQVAGAAAGVANQFTAGTADTSRGVAGQGTRLEIGFQLQYKKQEELGTADYDFTVIAPETRTHAPNAFFSALLTDTERDKQIREVNLDDPFFKTIDVDISTTADFDALDLKSIEIELQYGGTIAAPGVTGTAVLTPASPGPAHFQAFRDASGFGYRYRVTYAFGQSTEIAAQHPGFTTEWRSTMTRALVIHPADDIAMLRVFLEPGVVDWDVVDTIEARLSYDDTPHNFHAQRTFLVKESSQRQQWIVRLSDPTLVGYTLSYRWHMKDLSEIDGPDQAFSSSQIFVEDPFVDRLPVVLQPLVDHANVVRVDVELQYHDDAHHLDIRKNVELVGPDFRPQTVTIPIIDPRQREFTYRATLIKTNGAAEVQAAVTTDRLSIAITEGGIYFDVQVRILGRMEDAGLQAIQLDLRSEPLDGERQVIESRLFEPGGDTKATVRLLLRADRPQQFEYMTTVFQASGDPVESDWTAHENANLVIQPQRLVAHP